MRVIGTLLGSLLLTAGCSGGKSSMYIDGFDPPAPAAGETAFVSPVIAAIQPGQDITMCSYLDQTIMQDTDVTNFRAFQSQAGHHLMLAAARHSQSPNTHPCTEDDMVNILTFVAGGGADGASNFKGVPEGLAFRVPAGAQLMLQSHWINATGTTRDGQGVVYVTANPASTNVTPVDQFLADTTSFDIPAGVTYTATSTCKFQKDLNFFMYSGHMHEWGKHITLELLDTAGVAQTIYSQDWRPDYMTNPPNNAYTKDQPFAIHTGESVRVTCEWDNTAGTSDITFPKEMCYFVGYYFPGAGALDCSEGVWPTN
jgi:hypothetical protein